MGTYTIVILICPLIWLSTVASSKTKCSRGWVLVHLFIFLVVGGDAVCYLGVALVKGVTRQLQRCSIRMRRVVIFYLN